MFPPNGRAIYYIRAVNTINSDQHQGAVINIFNTPKVLPKPLTHEDEAGKVESVDDNSLPNIITRREAVWFDILVEHDPPGTESGDQIEGVLHVQCWVNRIAAHDPEEAGRKAERFLAATRGVSNIRVKRWRFSNRGCDG